MPNTQYMYREREWSVYIQALTNDVHAPTNKQITFSILNTNKYDCSSNALNTARIALYGMLP